jgi:hypothetical protein
MPNAWHLIASKVWCNISQQALLISVMWSQLGKVLQYIVYRVVVQNSHSFFSKALQVLKRVVYLYCTILYTNKLLSIYFALQKCKLLSIWQKKKMVWIFVQFEQDMSLLWQVSKDWAKYLSATNLPLTLKYTLASPRLSTATTLTVPYLLINGAIYLD